MDDAPLGRVRFFGARVAHNAVAHLARQVEVLEDVHHAQALLVVAEAERADLGERALARVAERRMPKVMPERDRLGQVLVQPQGARHRARDLRDLERVRQAGAVVVALGRDEHLRLVGKPPERLGVDDAVAVALEAGAVGTGLHLPQSARRAVRKRRPGGEHFTLAFFLLLSDCHAGIPPVRVENHSIYIYRVDRANPFYF